jgi:hypothetical protein
MISISKYRTKTIAIFMIGIFIMNFIPVGLPAFNGPSQPEVVSFSPHDTYQMVDPFTGDFTYNINLMDVGGYPVNLAYRSGIHPDDQASWVGLGWNINPGTVNRQVRGLPDDFNGDEIEKLHYIKPDITHGVNTGVALEVFGFDVERFALGVGLNLSLGINHNSYIGYGIDLGISPTFSMSNKLKSGKLSGSLNQEISLGINSNYGTSINANIGLSVTEHNKLRESTYGFGIGLSWSSMSGMESMTFETSFKNKIPEGTHFDNKLTKSYGGSFPLSMANPTFTPISETPMDIKSFSFRMKLGLEGVGVLGGVTGGYYYSESKLRDTYESIPSYGYMYEQNAGGGRVLHDINRYNDGPFQEEVPVLPITSFTQDVYTVSAQGLSGSFRPFRGAIGMVSDTRTNSKSFAGNLGAEIGGGNLVHAGVDVVVNMHNNITQPWIEQNALAENLTWNDNSRPADFEHVVFKNPGEFTRIDNPELFDRIGGFEAVNVPVGNDNAESRFTNRFKEVNESLGPGQNYKTERVPRSTLFTTYTAKEARETSLEPEIRSYNTGLTEYRNDITGETSYEFGYRKSPRITMDRKDHHLSEIRITNQEGNRFVYGIPVYQNQSSDVVFNIGRALAHDELVEYQPGIDNMPHNGNGRDHYYNKTTTPAHPTSFLLTAILSPDYIDITGNGPSSDDFGTYTKFNYQKIHDNYRWRIPFQENTANYNSGENVLQDDNMASYSYGEKEIWYLHSIESKNYIAEFTISDREDGIGVRGENGGPDIDLKIKKLDKITLYAKADRLKNGEAAIPIKTVYFEYDYSLCPGIPDQFAPGQGKLTLKKVSFAYGKSYKEKHSPYIFEYSPQNYPYNHLAKDRWANHKSNSTDLPNDRFPFTDQDRSNTDLYASAWHLTSITLPSGGRLSIEYESDDYAFVQDHRAMEMYPILGVGSTNDFSEAGNVIYRRTESGNIDHNYRYIFFELKHPTSNPDLLEEYVKGIEQLYFNSMVDVSGDTARNDFEEVEGFIPMFPWTYNENFGVVPSTSGSANIGWIKLPLIRDDDAHSINDGRDGSHPFTKAAWEKLQKSLYHYVEDNTGPSTKDALELIEEMGSLIETIADMATTFQGKMENDLRGNEIILRESYIRLNSPDKIKLGGGSRVKRILINDNWEAMNPTATFQEDFTYGQEYIYTMEENFGTSATRQISSGVAAYEPLVGGAENPLVLPIKYRIQKELALDVIKYILEPIGECFFPHPQVGYRQVKVRNLKHRGVSQNATGHELFEFYTAMDFPVRVSQTDLLYKPYEFIWPPFTSEKNATVSQGFAIELNNMHGVPRAKKVFQETDSITPISSVEYIYKVNPSDAKQLDNSSKIIDHPGSRISDGLIGVNYDFIVDGREFKSESISPGVQVNTDGFIVGFIPLMFPIPYPEFSTAKSRFRSLTTTKLIYRTGLLEKVISKDLGSSVQTERLAFDGITGEPVIVSIEDEFGGRYYKTNMPAYWPYEGMGPAYLSTGIFSDSVTITDGLLISGLSPQLLHKADLLSLDPLDRATITESDGGYTVEDYHPYKGWIYSTNRDGVRIIDQMGDPFPSGSYRLKVLRSGKRNLLSSSAGDILTKSNPIQEDALRFDQVLDASTFTYSDHWQTYMGFNVPEVLPECNCVMLSIQNQDQLSTLISSGPEIGTEFLSLYNSLAREDSLITDGIALSDKAPLLDRFLRRFLGDHPLDYSAQKRGFMLQSRFTNSIRSGTCDIQIKMEDESIFPDSVVGFAVHEEPLVVDSDFSCGNIFSFRAIVQYVDPIYPGSIVEKNVLLSSSCFPFFVCNPERTEYVMESCGIGEGDIINPYLTGILGNWKPLSSYKYVTNRTSGSPSDAGQYEQFHDFWNLPLIRGDVNREMWQEAGQTLVFDPHDKVLLTEDPLDVQSGQIYGYAYTVPIATADNASYQDIAYEGFEDYQYRNTVNSPYDDCPLPDHFAFEEDVNITDKESHSGKYSIVINSSITMERQITAPCDFEDSGARPGSASVYLLNDCDLIRSFSPQPGNYLVSAWVKENPREGLVLNYSSSNISVSLSGGGSTGPFLPEGPFIDGWQRIEGIFTIPEGATSISLTLSASGTAWFDDIRIQPFGSMMNTYVYDPLNLSLKALLNENNYTTFFEYDGEGKMIRKKAETERGIKTIQEINFAKFKSGD